MKLRATLISVDSSVGMYNCYRRTFYRCLSIERIIDFLKHEALTSRSVGDAFVCLAICLETSKSDLNVWQMRFVGMMSSWRVM
jgi:hypothetical protein